MTFFCNATRNPVPTISWSKDGSPVSNNSRISLSDDNKQLTITNLSRTDSGEYRCVGNNSLSNPAKVDVHCKQIVLFLMYAL